MLFVQYGLLTSWDYFFDSAHLFAGILGYGLVLSVFLSLMVVALASWVRQTVPFIMVWTIAFVFCRLLAGMLVDALHYDSRWRLIDLWNDAYVVGSFCMGVDLHNKNPAKQPQCLEAALVLGAVCLLCLVFWIRRIRAVEIVK